MDRDMLIRREDFKNINELTKGSSKNIWFICDNCGIGILQSYKNYIKTDTDLCRRCRNRETAKREDVKDKQSKATKEKWKDLEFREKVSNSLSISCKKAWDNDDGSRKRYISENNPMKNKEIRDRVAYNEAVSDEEIQELLKSINYTFISKELGNRGGSVITFKCDNGHIDSRRLDVIRHGARCKYCTQYTSRGEREIRDWLINLIDQREIYLNDKKVIWPYELDICLPNYNLAIEYNGLFWHSEQRGKDKYYHLNKTELCKERGIDLIHIFEDEWEQKKDIVKNRLKHLLGINDKKVYARKCVVKEINNKIKDNFLNNTHIQGTDKSTIKLGLYHGNELVSVMTFSKPSISKGSKNYIEYSWELNRFCSKYLVIGGFGKLLTYFKNNYRWNYIFSYVDRRWNSGKAYEKVGFRFEKYTKPNYWYCKTIANEPTRYHRYNFRKDKIKDWGGGNTEKEIMDYHSWNRIWDCGNLKFVIYNG